MNLDKATKLIAKRIKKGFQGYPQISLTYSGTSPDIFNKVIICFTLDDGSKPQEQSFSCSNDIKQDETIQTTLLKIIERSQAKSVLEFTTPHATI